MAKFYDLIRWTIWFFQLIFAVISITFFCMWYSGGGGFEIIASLIFLWLSFHCYWLTIQFNKWFVKSITNFENDGPHKQLNRRGRRRMKRHLVPIIKKTLNKN